MHNYRITCPPRWVLVGELVSRWLSDVSRDVNIGQSWAKIINGQIFSHDMFCWPSVVGQWLEMSNFTETL